MNAFQKLCKALAEYVCAESEDGMCGTKEERMVEYAAISRDCLATEDAYSRMCATGAVRPIPMLNSADTSRALIEAALDTINIRVAPFRSGKIGLTPKIVAYNSYTGAPIYEVIL